MPRLFSAESNVSGFQSVGPEATANAGSPHAASIGAGSAPIGGQHPGQPVLNAGGRSFLQARQFPGPKKPADQPGTATATVPPASRISGTGGAPPGPGGSLSPAAGWIWQRNLRLELDGESRQRRQPVVRGSCLQRRWRATGWPDQWHRASTDRVTESHPGKRTAT